MTFGEMMDVINDYCYNTTCDCCKIKSICRSCNGDLEYDPDLVLEAYDVLTKSSECEEDIVNHPNHYTNGGMECIDEMILVFGKDIVANFCLCNVWKYRYRATSKNGEEDIKKSHWYMNKYKELMSNG